MFFRRKKQPDTDQRVLCWGRGTGGELGDNTGASSPTPVRAGTLTGVTSIAAGSSACGCCRPAASRVSREWLTNHSLPPAQARDGSWEPIDVYCEYAGDDADDRVYSTAMCVLSLEVYYRYFTPLLRVR